MLENETSAALPANVIVFLYVQSNSMLQNVKDSANPNSNP